MTASKGYYLTATQLERNWPALTSIGWFKPDFSKASMVQTGCSMPTPRFSGTLLVLPTGSVYPLNQLVGVL